MFGPLQATTAPYLGIWIPVLLGATNASAGAMGKTISPQTLSARAAPGVGRGRTEGEILAQVAVDSLILTTMIGLLADAP